MFHSMSSTTTVFEYPQFARRSSSSCAADSLTSMDAPLWPVALPRRAARVVGWATAGSCRCCRSGACESDAAAPLAPMVVVLSVDILSTAWLGEEKSTKMDYGYLGGFVSERKWNW
uniref:Uncharacterized protein MANES_17G084000 n=1 Tax=Rhizophora mucronata TaxID=61149 RepID=A0A2P2J1U4_RHIMU